MGVLHSSFATHFRLQQQQEIVWVVRAVSLFMSYVISLHTLSYIVLYADTDKMKITQLPKP